MSEEIQTTDQNENQNDAAAELNVLKERAKLLGINFSNNIKVETLRQKIEDHMNGEEKTEVKSEPNPLDPADVDTEGKTPGQIRQERRNKIIKEQTKLVRLRITNMDPKKKDLPGEIITVANELIGTIRKFVPFGEVTDDGYHVPYCIYKNLENRRFLSIRTRRNKQTGNIETKTQWVKEFALEVLPQLTQEELDKLANQQAAAGSISDD